MCRLAANTLHWKLLTVFCLHFVRNGLLVVGCGNPSCNHVHGLVIRNCIIYTPSFCAYRKFTASSGSRINITDGRPTFQSVMPRSAIIDPVTLTANRTGSTRSRWRTNSDRVLPIRSHWRFDGWPPGFNPVPVDIRSKLTARIKFNNHLVYIKRYSFHSASIHPPSLAVSFSFQLE